MKARITTIAAALRNRKTDLWLCGAIAAAGLLRTLATYRFSFGLGDQSTFFSFAKNIVSGEALYKDFIHFRMPGAYYLYAAFLKVFGAHFSSLALAMGIESYVLYPVLLYVSAKLLTRSRAISLSAAVLCVILPGIFQLRAVLALLAVAIYCRSRRQNTVRGYLFAGAALGLDLVFGQETAIMAGATMACLELTAWRPGWRQRLASLIAGFGLIAGPFLMLIAVFSSLSNFIYYGFDYALIIQPKFMNLPYPALGLHTIIFYLPFAVYLLSFAILYASRRLSLEAIALIGFGLLRMISALGRADGAHLLFSLPETFIILPYAVAQLPKAQWSRLQHPDFGIRFILLIAVITGAILTTSSVLLLCLPVLTVGLTKKPDLQTLGKPLFIPAALLSGLFFAAIFATSIYGGVHEIAHDFKHRHDTQIIDGTYVAEPMYGEVETISKTIQARHLTTLFSYPIEPYYYSLVPHHATRFMTFEPQTTNLEQSEAIADLQKNKPPLAVMDMLQAEALSPSLWRINDYIGDHYTVTQRVIDLDYLHILVPKTTPSVERHLLFDMYVRNNKSQVSAYHIDHYDGAVTDGMDVAIHAAFTMNVDRPEVLQSAMTLKPNAAAIQPTSACATATISAGSNSQIQRICMSDGTVQVDLRRWVGKTVTITLSKGSSPDVLWVDPTVLEIKPG